MSREYKDVNPTKLALPSIGFSILGTVLATLRYTSIGLSIIFIAALFIFGTFIYKRLYFLGAEKWALGSIIVWFGFFLFSLPIIGFAWGLMTNSTRLIFVFTGLIFVFLGLLTEFLDLNMKLINILKRARVRLSEFYLRFKTRLLSSPWIFLMLISSTLFVISFIIPTILNPFNSFLRTNGIASPRFVLLYIFSISLLIEVRELISVLFTSFINILYLFLQGLTRRIRQVKGLIIGIYLLIVSFIKKSYQSIKKFTLLVLQNNYSIGFIAFVTFGIISFYQSDQILFGISTLMLFAGLTTLIVQKPEFIANTVSNIHHSAYRQSFKIRKRFAKIQSFDCDNCGAAITSGYAYCVECNHKLPVCSVCKNQILPGSEVMECSQCNESGHIGHLDRWLMIKAICPNCRIPW